MGFRFRKSINLGPLRLNLSKSGIGYSVGGKGARYTKTANGKTRTTLNIPGTGLSYVEETGKGKNKKMFNKPEFIPISPDSIELNEPKGHSLILHILFGGFVFWIPAIYITCSKNHYWHL